MALVPNQIDMMTNILQNPILFLTRLESFPDCDIFSCNPYPHNRLNNRARILKIKISTLCPNQMFAFKIKNASQ
jgi:hypothetical protein